MVAAAAVVACARDPRYPEFVRFPSVTLNLGLPNPDTHYSFACLDGAHRYRIHGNRGSAHVFAVEVWAGHVEDLTNSRVFSSSCDWRVESNGEIEIVLSTDEQEGNWLELPPGPGWVWVRQVHYDWETERPGVIVIEREGAEYPPPVTVPDLREQLHFIEPFLRSWDTAQAGLAGLARAATDTIPFGRGLTIDGTNLEQTGFMGQYYGMAAVNCEAEQAIIIEVVPPRCRFWGFHLGTEYTTAAVEWDARQSSINGHQAVLDDDGVFRVVISQRDPGVPNWLDPGGRTSGLLIAGRYLAPESVPDPQLRTVGFDELGTALPATTPRITPELRRESLRRRMLSLRQVMV